MVQCCLTSFRTSITTHDDCLTSSGVICHETKVKRKQTAQGLRAEQEFRAPV